MSKVGRGVDRSMAAQGRDMKHKAVKLRGDKLNWAVHEACGFSATPPPNYCGDWAHGGPIIERERIATWFGRRNGVGLWFAMGPCLDTSDGRFDDTMHDATGPTPQIAAMRCFVASKLGEEVELP